MEEYLGLILVMGFAVTIHENEKARIPFAEQAYSELKRQILTNELPHGSQFLEQEIAEQLSMSRTPTREAMVRLANEGLVEVRPRHGMRVLPISPKDMAEVYGIITALESSAAGILAGMDLSEDGLQSLMKAVDDMDTALEHDDLNSWVIADYEFHRQMVVLTGSVRMLQLVDTFRDQIHRVRMTTLHMRPKPYKSNEDHRAVVAAILARDVKKARDIQRNHQEMAAKMLIKLLNENHMTHI